MLTARKEASLLNHTLQAPARLRDHHLLVLALRAEEAGDDRQAELYRQAFVGASERFGGCDDASL